MKIPQLIGSIDSLLKTFEDLAPVTCGHQLRRHLHINVSSEQGDKIASEHCTVKMNTEQMLKKVHLMLSNTILLRPF